MTHIHTLPEATGELADAIAATSDGTQGQGTVPLLPIDAWEQGFYLRHESHQSGFFAVFRNIIAGWADATDRLRAVRGTAS